MFDAERERALVTALTETPRHIADILHLEPRIAEVAHKIAGARDVLYLGRGVNFPIAMEGALKLKEIWAIRIRLQILGRTRDLALFNLAIDSKLRGCDLVRIRVADVVHGSCV